MPPERRTQCRQTGYRDPSPHLSTKPGQVQYHHSVNVAFNDERASVVAIQCYSDDKLSRCPAIAGIDDGDDEQKVLRTFGNNAQAKISGVTKSLTYAELGVKLHLTKEQVYLLEVSTPGFVRH